MLQRWETKICWKYSLPQSGTSLTTTVMLMPTTEPHGQGRLTSELMEDPVQQTKTHRDKLLTFGCSLEWGEGRETDNLSIYPLLCLWKELGDWILNKNKVEYIEEDRIVSLELRWLFCWLVCSIVYQATNNHIFLDYLTAFPHFFSKFSKA